MYSTLLTIPFLFGAAQCLPSTPRLVIFANADGSKTSSPSTLDVPIGQYLTLICYIVDAGSQLADKAVFWKNKRKKELRTNFLSFTPLTREDQGTYTCVDHGRGLSAEIRIRVETENLDDGLQPKAKYSSRRKKRDEQTDRSMDQIMEEIMRESNAIFRLYEESRSKESTTESPKESVQLKNEEYYYSSDNRNTDEKTQPPKRTSRPSVLENVLLFAGAPIVIFAACVLVKVCGKKGNSRAVRFERNQTQSGLPVRAETPPSAPSIVFVRPRPATQCSHISCERTRLVNPRALCRFEDYNVQDSVAINLPIVSTREHQESANGALEEGGCLNLFPTYAHSTATSNSDSGAINLSILRAREQWERSNGTIGEREYLDSPPTYAHSIANSPAGSMHNLHKATSDNTDAYILPPSYNEAMSARKSTPWEAPTMYSYGGNHDYESGGDASHDSGGGGISSYSCDSGGDVRGSTTSYSCDSGGDGGGGTTSYSCDNGGDGGGEGCDD